MASDHHSACLSIAPHHTRHSRQTPHGWRCLSPTPDLYSNIFSSLLTDQRIFMLKYRKRTITFTALTLKRSVKQLIKLFWSWFRLDNLCYVLFAGISFAKNKTIVKPSVSLQLGCGDLTSLLLQQSYCTIFLGHLVCMWLCQTKKRNTNKQNKFTSSFILILICWWCKWFEFFYW